MYAVIISKDLPTVWWKQSSSTMTPVTTNSKAKDLPSVWWKQSPSISPVSPVGTMKDLPSVWWNQQLDFAVPAGDAQVEYDACKVLADG